MSTKSKSQPKPQLHERFQGARLQIATAWGGAHGPRYDDIEPTGNPRQFTVALTNDLHDKTEAEQKALRLLQSNLKSHKLEYVSHTHKSVTIEVPADWIALPGHNRQLSTLSKPDKALMAFIRTFGPVGTETIKSHGHDPLALIRLEAEGYVVEQSGGAGWALAQPGDGLPPGEPTDGIGTAGPVIPEPPVDSQDAQPVKTISDSEARGIVDETVRTAPTPHIGTDALRLQYLLVDEKLGHDLAFWQKTALELAGALDQRETVMRGSARQNIASSESAQTRITELEAENAQHVVDSHAISSQITDLMAQRDEARADVLRLDRQLAEKDGLQRTADQNLLLAQDEIRSLRNRNQVQERMLREVTGQGAKAEFKTIVHTFRDHESTKGDDELASLINQGWTKWDSTTTSIFYAESENVWHSRIVTLTRPVQQKPASGPDLTTERGIPVQAKMVQAVGQPVTIIGVDPKVPEPALNQLDPNSYIARIRAAGGDVDAVLAEDNAAMIQSAAAAANAVRTQKPSTPFEKLPAQLTAATK